MFNLGNFEAVLNKAFKQITKSQAEALSLEISANYVAGRTAAEKHQSIKTIKNLQSDNNIDSFDNGIGTFDNKNYQKLPKTTNSVDSEAKEDQEDEGLSDSEKAEIAVLVALFLGYLKKYNDTAQAQILAKAKEIIQAGGSPEDVQKYTQSVLSGKEPVVINNVGKKKKEIYVDKNLTLSEVSKTITKPYAATVTTYATMLGENASHSGYETGRKMSYKAQGYEQWVFTGPSDERARPWHVALLGQVYAWGTQQSSHAERCLQEPRCRHRADIFYNDPEKDVPAKYWQDMKDEAGLYWDEDKQRWGMRINDRNTPKTTVEKKNTKAPNWVPKQKAPEVKVKKEKKVVKEVQKVEVKRTPEEVEKIIKEKELSLRDRSTEKGILFDKNGKLLIEKDGTEDTVHFTEKEVKGFRGNIFTHNHPGASSSFSLEDIHMACEYGLKEVRATTVEGTFRMTMADGSNFNSDLYNEKIRDTFEKHRKFQAVLHNNRMRDEKIREKITEEESIAWATKAIWMNASKELSELKYELIRWN